ncbi:2Fe-2S iron-sulfur cluster-binding protein, partial [Desulfobacula sp.]|nr:2Fe-2S iron-sulfur cluster binding domain-containing protein [Desulfobacula sp.]
MGTCINHPEIQTSYLCMKHNIYLCDKCLVCRDPDIYCKFRSSCPIHFISTKDFESKPDEIRSKEFSIVFQPGDVKISVPKGTNLLEATKKADLYVNASCNGKGSCGKCKVIIESGTIEKNKTSLLSDKEQKKGYVLACQTQVTDNLVIKIPEETLEKKLQTVGMGEEATKKLSGLVVDIDPMVKKYTIQLEPPTMEDTISDLERLKRNLKQGGCDTSKMSSGIRVMRQLAKAVRDDNWKVTVSVLQKKCSSEIVDVRPASKDDRSLGMAVDLGTTSIVVYIVDMQTGEVLSAASGHNSQASCGDDVINRIVCSEKEGIKKLQKMALSTINNLSQRALESLAQTHKNIENITISGNTTMVHLLLGIDARYIRREPYIPTITEFPIIKAGHIGLKAAHYA